MGSYNPDAPYILGNEWAGIHEEGLLFGVNQNTFEQGYTFTVPAGQSIPLDHIRAYVDPASFSRPLGVQGTSTLAAAIYPFGAEADSGPIQRVVIPVVSGASSGTATSNDWNVVSRLSSASVISPPTTPTGLQLAEAVYDNTGTSSVHFFQPLVTNPPALAFSFEFDVKSYAAQLLGKRILAVNFLYQLVGPPGLDQISLNSATTMDLYIRGGIGLLNILWSQVFSSTSLQRVGVGEVSGWWSQPAGLINQSMPWNLAALMNFDTTTTLANRLGVTFRRRANNIVSGANYALQYVALEVIYCEETRLAVGAYQPNIGGTGGWQYGAQIIPMFQPNNYAAKTILGPGTYTATVMAPSGQEGDAITTANSGYAPLNTLRTYYDLSTHFGRQISKPFPVENALGETFTVESTSVLPQLSIHVTGAGATKVPSPYAHVYGRQAAAPVYGGISATQAVDLSVTSVGAIYPQARIYARRFGATEADLGLALGPGLVNITPAQLDALPEVIDGWREVTLPWDIPYAVTGGATASLVAFDQGLTLQYIDNFEDGSAADWVPTNCTFIDDLAHPHSGIFSAKMVVVGSPASAFARSPRQPVVALQAYAFTGWFFSTGTPTVTLTVDWRSAAGSIVSTSSTNATLVANTPTKVTLLATAPAGAALAGFGPTLGGSPATGTTIWFDDGALWLNLGSNAAGNRWEVLGVSAPAITGMISGADQVPSRLTEVAPVERLGLATYLAPSGAAVSLTWKSPLVSGATVDPSSDLVFLLSSAAPAVTGFAVAQATQALTAVLDCATPPNCIPTGLTYNQLSWQSAPVSGGGFGYYEVSRADTVDPTFRVIAQIADVTKTSMRDFEARIGVATTYQIAIANGMAFYGPAATAGPTTIAAPGIGGRNVSEGILTFTSNTDQTGNSNLAYTPSWPNAPSEDVTFPEASRAKLQWEYGRNFFSQFEPTERGGEQFSRTLEIQNAAASGPQIENGFRSLRDLAWTALPYVCVRNEIGDRWFAAVTVPGGSFQRNRSIQLAQVQVTQISEFPSIVTAV